MNSSRSPHIIYGSFEWDPKKAHKNIKAHRVSFEEAVTVFDDPLFIIFRDPEHSFIEQRYIIIGESKRDRYLIVSFTERFERTRIISARELNPKERRNYEQKKGR